MSAYKRLLIVSIAIAVAAFVIFKELNPPRKVAPIRYYVARVISSGAQINGQTARLVLDTGSATTRISKTEAERLGLKTTAVKAGGTTVLSEPTYLTLGGHTFMAPLGVEDYPDPTEDGFISWPAIRDNILVFDPDHHVIRAVAELPPETAGWTKLKVLRSTVLELEVTLPDGKKGAVAVDTGSGIGLSLPSAQWKEWRASHPQATLINRHFHGPFIGNGTTDEAWADQLQLGPITFTDVPIREAPPREENEFINNFAGLIGLYALTRMDLVLDAKNDAAYVHSRNPPGPPYPPFQRPELDETATKLYPNWKLDRSVQSDVAAILVETALLKTLGGSQPAALAEFDQVVELYPNYADAYRYRGAVKISLQDWTGALVDFSRCIELEPQHAYACYYYRGVEKEYQGDFEGALADYAKEIEFSSNTTANAILRHQLLLLRLHRPAEDFAKTVTNWKAGWSKTVGQFLAGNLNEADFLAAANKGTTPNIPTQQCSADSYIGLLRLFKGDLTGAREFLQKAVAVKLDSFHPVQYCAQAELQRLDGATK